MRRGSVSERTRKCGRQAAPAKKIPKRLKARTTAGHGRWPAKPTPGISARNKPSSHGSKSSKGISFENRRSSIGRLPEQWADAQLERSPAASREAAEKGGLQTDLQTKSSGKSKHSYCRVPVDRRLGFRSGRNGRAAPRLCARQRMRWSKGSTRTPAIMRDRNCPPAEPADQIAERKPRR
jgi:hypothetical protein